MTPGAYKKSRKNREEYMEDQNQPYVRIETITPEKAEMWLNLNTHNRDLTPSRVKGLGGAIERGEWCLNGDSIVFSGNGNGDGGVLLNGQHRLHAVVETGMPIRVIVLYNAAFAAQETMDSGMGRSLSAKLKLRGESYYAELSSALSLAFTFDKFGEPRAAGAYSTHQQLLTYLEDNPGIRDGAYIATRLRGEFGSPGGSWMGWYFLSRRSIGCDLTTEFFELLISGVGLEADSPVYQLRSLLLKQKQISLERRFGTRLIAALVCKSINAFVLGQEMKVLKWDRREQFPALITTQELAVVA